MRIQVYRCPREIYLDVFKRERCGLAREPETIMIKY